MRSRNRAGRVRLVLALLVMTVVAGWAIAPAVFTRRDPFAVDPDATFAPPGAAHWLGTDNLGRDLYARVVYGTASSVPAALLAVTVALLVGGLLGLLAGYLRGTVDTVVTRGIDLLMSIPAFLLAMSLITTLGFGTVNVALAVGIVSIASVARLMRAEVLRIGSRPYITAARVSGRGQLQVLFLHVLPNAMRPVAALTALEFAAAVLGISALSFLGLGAQPPSPEWGALIAAGRGSVSTQWWLSIAPGVVIAVVVIAVNVLSEYLQAEEAGI
ncbi:ABC transporter permease [Rhodococcus jostii]|uniref:ABC transporter permease n=1 Tax=Rhodococcus jostii TaxID=132919 RepID=A0ABU4CTD6_RHOJO|nr:ABC transporter permease [Rhodococcus jostii]MDV6286799.1 ABC transporter permease [Rhodococcus jostii]